LGGLIAAEFASRFPSRVNHLVLMNPVGMPVPLNFTAHFQSSFLHVVQRLCQQRILSRLIVHGIGRLLHILSILYPVTLSDLLESLSDLQHPIDRGETHSVSSHLKQSLLGFSLLLKTWLFQMNIDPRRPIVFRMALVHTQFFGDFSEIFCNVGKSDVPILLIWGIRDSIFPLMNLQRFGDSLPSAKILRLENADHSAFLSEPVSSGKHLLEFIIGATNKEYSQQKTEAR